MDNTTLALRDIPLQFKQYRTMVESFLRRHELTLDQTVERYIGYFSGETLVAGAGYGGNIIKCVAVDDSLRGQGITNALLSRLLKELYERGYANILLFTKPENETLFAGAGFTTVESAAKALLMESNSAAFGDYLKSLEPFKQDGQSAAIVMNCNPFTLGHQYLVETAAEQCDSLHLFLVQEERSIFPYSVRKELLLQGVAHIENVHLHDGGQYIITSATFPNYFIKSGPDAAAAQAELDLRIFGRHIAPTLNITRRFVGDEPYCAITKTYNTAMQAILPGFGVQTTVIPRKERAGQAISALWVRELLRSGVREQFKTLVPATTYAFLTSAAAEPIIRAMQTQTSFSRH